MSRIADLELLARTADLGSLTAAAKALDMSPAGANAAIKRLEAQWGVALFVRSTRSLRLSAEGERLMPHLRQALEALAQARTTVATGARRSTILQGELLRCPRTWGAICCSRILKRFGSATKLALRLLLSDRNTDLMRAPVDIALRYGAPSDSARVALPLVPDNRRLLVASPAYIARQGIPASPAELSQHEALRFMLGDACPRLGACRSAANGKTTCGRHSANDGEDGNGQALGLGRHRHCAQSPTRRQRASAAAASWCICTPIGWVSLRRSTWWCPAAAS